MQRTAMSTSQEFDLSSISVMALFRRIQAGRDLKNNTRTDYNLKREEYDRIQRALLQDEELRCFVETKIQ